MKIVNVNGTDTGGQAERLSRFINKYTPHESRAFIHSLNYINYPIDVLYKKPLPNWIKNYWATADILHCHIKWRICRPWPPFRSDVGRVLHQHGRLGLNSTYTIQDVYREDRRGHHIRVVSTINLLSYVRDNPKRWFPTPVDMDYLQKSKRKHRYPEHDDKIRIMHSPTQRHLKHTDMFLKIFKELQEKHKNIELILVENKTYPETQVARANADIIFDQLLLQHGSNGLEAMAMGKPVIAGCVSNPLIKDKIEEVVGKLPFVYANEETLKDVLEQLIVDESMRKEYGKIGYDYITKFHLPPYITDLAIKTYKEAIEMRK